MKEIRNNKNAVIVHKERGETPLEALERYRATRPELADIPMTYAGRLDPMAEGELLILTGDECKHKERWLGLDKEYEVEIVFGIETDTYDALGLAGVAYSLKNSSNIRPRPDGDALQAYVGRFAQEYPPYSSRTVNGKQLHELARANELPDEMPTKEVEIYSIELLEKGSIGAADLKARILGMIDKVKGDFRQEEIKHRWTEILTEGAFETAKIRVKCSSGTYMRSLAHRMGKDMGQGAFACTIKRTMIDMHNSRKSV